MIQLTEMLAKCQEDLIKAKKEIEILKSKKTQRIVAEVQYSISGLVLEVPEQATPEEINELIDTAIAEDYVIDSDLCQGTITYSVLDENNNVIRKCIID